MTSEQSVIHILKQDIALRPRAFAFSGPTTEAAVSEWMKKSGVRPGQDLIDVWLIWGEMTIFTSEYLWAPGVDLPWTANSLKPHYEFDEGEDDGGFVVIGVCDAERLVVDRRDGTLAVLREGTDKEVIMRFSSFGDWYLNYLRPEFGEMFGLPQLSE